MGTSSRATAGVADEVVGRGGDSGRGRGPRRRCGRVRRSTAHRPRGSRPQPHPDRAAAVVAPPSGLPPWAATLSPAERTFAHWTERALYLLLFVVPLTGLWLVVASDDAVAVHVAGHIAFFVALAAHVGLVLRAPDARPRPPPATDDLKNTRAHDTRRAVLLRPTTDRRPRCQRTRGQPEGQAGRGGHHVSSGARSRATICRTTS